MELDSKQLKALSVITTQVNKLKVRTKKDKFAIEYINAMLDYLMTGKI